MLLALAAIVLLAALLSTGAAPAGADAVVGTIAVGAGPRAVAVNPITNKVYVLNEDSVTVIDGPTQATVTVGVGISPTAIAVNTANNKIYVANGASSSVTVIDGHTNATNTLGVGVFPIAIAVNPATGKVYVANFGSNEVTVIDGVTNGTNTIAVASSRAIAVNPTTNKVYVGNGTVIDGDSNSVSTIIPVAGNAVGVNPITNKVYFANGGHSTWGNETVEVLDGNSNAVTTVTVGGRPRAVAVNPATNKVYIVSEDTGDVTVIDGDTNATTGVSVGAAPSSIAVNASTNKVYVVSDSGLTVIDGVTNDVTATINVGSAPWGIAVNPVTGKVYVADLGSNDVAVIDGNDYGTHAIPAVGSAHALAVNPFTNRAFAAEPGNRVVMIDGDTEAISTVGEGPYTWGVAINPATNKLYVANDLLNTSGDFTSTSTLTIIDLTSMATATVAVGVWPESIAVDPVANKVYVANRVSNDITIIDGTTNATTTAIAGSGSYVGPWDIAVNPVINKVYAVHPGDDSVTVIDGRTNAVSIIATGDAPRAIAVNPVTNRIYVANYHDVTVIDGESNVTTTISIPANTRWPPRPTAIAVNPVTNKIYVANWGSGNLSIIDGLTNAISNTAGDSLFDPRAISVDLATNKVYIPEDDHYLVSVIDGATGAATRLILPEYFADAQAIAVNPVTSEVFVGYFVGGVAAITPQPKSTMPLTVAISSLTGNITYHPNPTFAFTATSGYTPTAPAIQQVYYQVDTWTGPWLAATPKGAIASATLSPLAKGMHVLYAYAVDGTEATSINTGSSSSPIIGQIAAYPFLVSGASVAVASGPNPSSLGQPTLFTATVSSSTPGIITPTGVVTFTFDGTSQAAAGISNGIATYLTSTVAVGTHSVTATYGGDDTFDPAASPAVTHTVRASSFAAVSSAPNPSLFGEAVTFTATVTSTSGTPTGAVTFTIDGAPAVTTTLAAGRAGYITSTLAPGAHTVEVYYGGDDASGPTSATLLGGQQVWDVIVSGTVTLQGREVSPPADPYSIPLIVQLYPAGAYAATYSATVHTDGHAASRSPAFLLAPTRSRSRTGTR